MLGEKGVAWHYQFLNMAVISSSGTTKSNPCLDYDGFSRTEWLARTLTGVPQSILRIVVNLVFIYAFLRIILSKLQLSLYARSIAQRFTPEVSVRGLPIEPSTRKKQQAVLSQTVTIVYTLDIGLTNSPTCSSFLVSRVSEAVDRSTASTR